MRIAIALSLALTLSTSCLATPLFDLMKGRWEGKGERVQRNSGKRILIAAQVDTFLERASEGQEILCSRNRITETSEIGQPLREYQRVYWLRQVAPGSFEFGTFDAATGAFVSSGTAGIFDLQAKTLRVRQSMGNFVIESTTRFDPDDSVGESYPIVYSEEWRESSRPEEAPWARAQIRYRLSGAR